MVHADLDARQENIKRAFKKRKQDIDTFELFSSKLNMRKRFPFKQESLNQKENISELNKKKMIAKMTSQQKEKTKKEISNISNEKLKNILTNIVEQN